MEAKHTQPIFPWYKERLHTKYLKASTNESCSIGNCLHLVNVSFDDFGDCSSVLYKPQRGVSPLIFHDTPKHDSSQKPRKWISKEHACFSKQMTQKQIRREYVTAVEEKLKQHPLAMYPHYKDHMTPELFDKVVSVLDPDMCANSSSALPTPTGDHAEDEKNCKEPSKEEEDVTKHNIISPSVQDPTSRNPYVLQINANGIKKCWTVKMNQLSTHKDKRVDTKHFSKWFVSLDKETNVTKSGENTTLHHQLSPFKWRTPPSVSQVKNEILSHRQDNYISEASEPNKVQKD